MGLKAGLTLFEQCTKYAEACGKTHILQTLPQDLSKIDICGLKLAQISEDGLQLSETAQFAKKLLSRFKTSELSMELGGLKENFLKFEGSKMGSNPAFWCKNKQTGELFYIKTASSIEKQGQLESELLTTKLYNLAGIKTPDVQICKLPNGTIGIASRFEEGMHDIDSISNVQSSFAADAWLANWDSLLNGNTMIKNGSPVKIDCGGALRYRAQGKLKPNFNNQVEELVTLIDGRNWISTEVYGSMTPKDLINSFKKVTAISNKQIRETVADPELAKTLVARKNFMTHFLGKIEANPRKNEPMSKYMQRISDEVSAEYKTFSENWDTVLKSIGEAERKPRMTQFGFKVDYETLTDEEKVLASYITEDFSDASNQFLRNGVETNVYSWWAKKGLDYKSLPKYRDALNFALRSVESKPSTTFRWQPQGAFNKDFKIYKKGPETSINIDPSSPEYMTIKRLKLERQNKNLTAENGDIIEDPTFLSTGNDMFGIEYFRDDIMTRTRGKHPELIIVKGKSGKVIPRELAGERWHENETLFSSGTQYRFLEEKKITSPSQIENLQETMNSFQRKNFAPFKAIYLEEV